jgi:hypothetical protein
LGCQYIGNQTGQYVNEQLPTNRQRAFTKLTSKSVHGRNLAKAAIGYIPVSTPGMISEDSFLTGWLPLLAEN